MAMFVSQKELDKVRTSYCFTKGAGYGKGLLLFHQQELDTYGKDLLLFHQKALDTVRTSYWSTKRSWIRKGTLIVPPKGAGYGKDLYLFHQKELDTIRTSYWSTKRRWIR